jgi:hypothetical protein
MIDTSKVQPENFWYFIGLITTDGNLSPDGRHIVLVSKDIDHLENVRTAMCLSNTLGKKSNARNKEKVYGVLQFGDVRFYQFLLSIGLSKRKSLTLGKIIVPRDYFSDFLRGVIDGDGGIRKWIHPHNGAQQWEVRITSGANIFSQWLQGEIEEYYGVIGTRISYRNPKNQNKLYVLKYGKLAAQKIFTCYDSSTLALARKSVLAQECMSTENRWSKSPTVL